MEKAASAAPLPADVNPQEPRRGFLMHVAAVVIGGIVTMFPFLAGMLVFFDPLRRKSAGAREIRVAPLDAVPDDGVPRRFPVIATRSDAWNRFPDEPIGAVYLSRQPGTQTVAALNACCPHAGCSVAYIAAQKDFRCPCHTSAFDMHGQRLLDVSKVPPRDMDSLVCDVRPAAGVAGKEGAKEIWVKFQNFHTGSEKKIAKA